VQPVIFISTLKIPERTACGTRWCANGADLKGDPSYLRGEPVYLNDAKHLTERQLTEACGDANLEGPRRAADAGLAVVCEREKATGKSRQEQGITGVSE
jgi:hypothetical protein